MIGEDCIPETCSIEGHVFGCPGAAGGDHELIKNHPHIWQGPGSHGYRWCFCGATVYPEDELVPDDWEEDEDGYVTVPLSYENREGDPAFNGAFNRW